MATGCSSDLYQDGSPLNNGGILIRLNTSSTSSIALYTDKLTCLRLHALTSWFKTRRRASAIIWRSMKAMLLQREMAQALAARPTQPRSGLFASWIGSSFPCSGSCIGSTISIEMPSPSLGWITWRKSLTSLPQSIRHVFLSSLWDISSGRFHQVRHPFFP